MKTMFSRALFLRRKFPRFDSYEKAMLNCGSGYESGGLISTVVGKTSAFVKAVGSRDPEIPNDYMRLVSGILWMIGETENSGSTFTVVDLGGGAGFHYFLSKLFINPRVTLTWIVVETRGMVEASKHLGNDELHFAESLDEAIRYLNGRGIDGLLCSSVLQYMPSMKESLLEINQALPRHIFITRTPLVRSDKPIYSIQESFISDSGPGPSASSHRDKLRVPITYYPRSQLELVFSKKYKLVARILEGVEGIWLDGKQVSVYGFAYSLKELS